MHVICCVVFELAKNVQLSKVMFSPRTMSKFALTLDRDSRTDQELRNVALLSYKGMQLPLLLRPSLIELKAPLEVRSLGPAKTVFGEQ